jgi:hypothetical protein
MPKLKSENIEIKDIKEYLTTSDDFQFELDIFRVCQNYGWDSVHGGVYQDPVTNKDRQFDIRAQMLKRNCLVKIAVECKNLTKNHPLLISRIPRLRNESVHQIIETKDLSLEPFANITPPIGNEKNVRVFEFTEGRSIFPVGMMLGKSTAQIGRLVSGELTSGDSEVYDKWTQAIASSYDLVRESTHAYLQTKKSPTFIYVQPILVIALDTLWVVDYNEDGSMAEDPKKVDECSLYLNKFVYPIAGNSAHTTISHLLIFTRQGFEIYLRKFTSQEHYWHKLFPGLLNARTGSF